MQNIAGAAGATLGYIAGNIPGAAIGYRLGRAMAPIRRGRYRSRRMPYGGPRGQGRYRARTAGGGYKARNPRDTVVTQQFDYKNQYRKKSMPKYKKKAWKKFVNKVNAVGIRTAGLKTIIFNDKIVRSNTAGNQNVMACCLYGNTGVNDVNAVGYSDMYRTFKNEPTIQKQSGEPANGCLMFASGILDITLRNLGEVDAEVDVYIGYHWKDTTNTDTALPAPAPNTRTLIEDLFNGGFNQEIATGNQPIDLTDRGATPFDISHGLSSSGFKIIKKQKFLMQPSRSVFLQHRDAKNHRLDWNNLGKMGYAKKNLTYEVLVVFKPSVAVTEDLVCTIGMGVTRKYGYTVLDWNQDENAYDP